MATDKLNPRQCPNCGKFTVKKVGSRLRGCCLLLVMLLLGFPLLFGYGSLAAITGGEDIAVALFWIVVVVLALFVGLIALMGALSPWECTSCGYKWKGTAPNHRENSEEIQ